MKVQSKKQKAWLERSRLLFRIKGFGPFFPKEGVTATKREIELINTMMQAQKELVSHIVESSRELGFNAKYRDICGKSITDEEYAEQNVI